MDGYNKRVSCASCGGRSFETILNLGDVPLAGYFPNKDELKTQSKYPLSLLVCNDCKLVQTDSVINPKLLFEDYRYLSSVGLSNHFEGVADLLNERYDVRDKNILEIGCNDGVLLEPLQKLGALVEGVDPAINVVKLAKNKGLQVYNDFFDEIRGIHHVLKPSGDFIFEVHYLKSLIDGKQWDNVYHEHIFYYSITALRNLFQRHNMTLVDFEEIPIHSGSIRVTVRNRNTYESQKVLDRIELESKTIGNVSYLKKYGEDVKKHISEFNEMIEKLSSKYTIAGYGASGRANMFCNLTNINKDVVKFIVDESPERCGRYIANTEIPIVSPSALKDSYVDLIIIFAWNYSKMIMDKTTLDFCRYLVAFPTVQVVSNYSQLKGFDSI